jgi:HK97 family phage portal protein
MTGAGVRIDEETAMRCSAVWAAVTLLANTVAMLPFKLMRRLPGGGKKIAYDHPLYWMTAAQPNPRTRAFNFKQTIQGHLGTWGNGYARIVYKNNRNATPIALEQLHPGRVTIKETQNSELIYEYYEKGAKKQFGAWEILHIPGFGFDGIKGLSPIGMARESIGLTRATEKFGAEFFGKGANFGSILKHPDVLSSKARDNLKKSVEEQAESGSHSFFILEEGMEWVKVNFPPEDSQFIETRKFNINDIARWYHVPPHMIGDLDRATFSNIEQQGIEYVTYTMLPWFVLWEQAFDAKLLKEWEREEYFFKFNVNALLRGDSVQRSTYQRNRFYTGSLSPNEIRELEDENPIPDGDKYYVQSNMVPVDMLEKVIDKGGIKDAEPNKIDEPKPEPSKGDTKKE